MFALLDTMGEQGLIKGQPNLSYALFKADFLSVQQREM